MGMTRRIDEKEELLCGLCAVYGFEVNYSWGNYWIDAPLRLNSAYSFNPGIGFTREELREWEDDKLEEVLLEFYLNVAWD